MGVQKVPRGTVAERLPANVHHLVSSFEPKYTGTGWLLRRGLDGFVAKLVNGLAEHAAAAR